MNIFFDLPIEHQIVILTELLDLKDFAKFHSAVFTKIYRKEFLALVTSEQCVFSNSFILNQEELILAWAVTNGIRFKEIWLHGENLRDAQTRRRIISHFAVSLEEIMIDFALYSNGVIATKDRTIDLLSAFEDVSRFCTRLKDLHLVQDCNEINLQPLDNFACMPTFVSSLPSLQSIYLDIFVELPVAWLLALSAMPLLRTVSLLFRSLEQGAQLPEQFTPSRSVRKLTLSSSAWLCKLFPNITTIKLSKVSNAAVETLAQVCPQIRIAHLNWDENEDIITAALAATSTSLLDACLHFTMLVGGRHV